MRTLSRWSLWLPVTGLWLALGGGMLRAQQGPNLGPPVQQGDGHQEGGFPPPPPGEHGPQHRGEGGSQHHGGMAPPDGQSPATTVSTLRGGLQLGPPGRWWNDENFAATLHLQQSQQRRMDEIFKENKKTLFGRFDALEQREQELEALTRGAKIDEETLFATIDRVTAARGELEKANAHMLLQLRAQLSSEQVRVLDEHRPGPRP